MFQKIFLKTINIKEEDKIKIEKMAKKCELSIEDFINIYFANIDINDEELFYFIPTKNNYIENDLFNSTIEKEIIDLTDYEKELTKKGTLSGTFLD